MNVDYALVILLGEWKENKSVSLDAFLNVRMILLSKNVNFSLDKRAQDN